MFDKLVFKKKKLTEMWYLQFSSFVHSSELPVMNATPHKKIYHMAEMLYLRFFLIAWRWQVLDSSHFHEISDKECRSQISLTEKQPQLWMMIKWTLQAILNMYFRTWIFLQREQFCLESLIYVKTKHPPWTCKSI